MGQTILQIQGQFCVQFNRGGVSNHAGFSPPPSSVKTFTFLILLSTSIVVNAKAVNVDPCHGSTITWDFSSQSKLEYFVDSWSTENATWERSEKKSSPMDVGRLNGLPKGMLYRVVGCDSADDCENSNAIWLPEMVCEGEQTPDKLQAIMAPLQYTDKNTGESAELYVQEKNDLLGKILDWNINMAVVAAHSLVDDAPPMEKPGYVVFTNQTTAELVRFNVWYYYELTRTGRKPDISGTGYEFYY